MTQPAYAGIGSRQTPGTVLQQMTVMASWLARRGWHLHSGGARGADSAFADGAPEARTIHLPWPRYQHHDGPDCHVPTLKTRSLCLDIASGLHPAWHRCSDTARSLHARNVCIVLGADLSTPVDAVVCWTPNGETRGGTGMGIRIARRFDIPVMNLGSMHPRAVCERLEEIRAAA